MAGSFQGFDSIAAFNTDAVLEALRRTMVFGLPEEDADKPTFWFGPTAMWVDADLEGNPWEWTVAPSSGSPEETSTQVICAYEFSAPLGRQGVGYTEAGEFKPNTVVATMFQEEFDDVYGFAYVTIGPPDPQGNRTKFWFRFWKPIVGFGDTNVYEVHCVAEGI